MDIGIIGVGAAGALTIIHLAPLLRAGDQIYWINRSGKPGRGVAYGTTRTEHLLNVRASGMGVIAGEPDHFWRWLNTEEGVRAAKTLCPNVTIGADEFLPRTLFGAYLDAMLADASRKTSIHVVEGEATAAHWHANRFTLSVTGAKETITVDHLVIATGNQPPDVPSMVSAAAAQHPSFFANAWSARTDAFYEGVAALPETSTIAILGMGLTMADVVMSLKKSGYKGKIVALSRRGVMARPHRKAGTYDPINFIARIKASAPTALAMLHIVQQEVKSAKADWRMVIDALRPHTQWLWQRLSTKEKQRFFHRLFTFWNVHRHRMPTTTADTLDSMMQEGSLLLSNTWRLSVDAKGGKLTVRYEAHGKANPETITAAAVINCIHPAYTINNPPPLLAAMLKESTVQAAPLGMGLILRPDGTAEGAATGRIHPIGNLRIEELLETTAVPELRDQAKAVAIRLSGARA